MDESFLTSFGFLALMVDQRIEFVVFITFLLGIDVKGETFNLSNV